MRNEVIMPQLSITDAAHTVGVNRSTIHRAIKTGKLSATIMDDGRRVINPSELERAFPSDRPKKQVTRNTVADSGKQQSATDAVVNVMEDQIATLRNQVERLQQDKADIQRAWQDDKTYLRARLDRAELERGTALRLLEDLRKPQRPWWQLWSRAA